MLDRCLPWPLCLKVALMSSAEKPWFLIMCVFSLSCKHAHITADNCCPGSREDSWWRYIDGFLITGLVAVWPSVAQCRAWLPHLLMCCCSYVLVPCCHAHLPQDILSIFRKCSHGGVVAAFGLSTRKIAMIDGTVAKKNNTHNQVFYVMSGRF